MSYYVLTDNTARGIKNILNSQISRPTSAQRYSPVAAYKDSYPHPFEVRWTESMISGGGYAIWLPPRCLQVDGTNISPEKWLPYNNGKICADVSSDWWYRLNDKVASSGNVDKLSSFNLYLNASIDEVIMSLSAEETWKGSNGFVHIAEINNYRSKPNVKSNLILDNTRHRPFDLIEDPSYTGPAHQWIMRYCMFEDGGKTIALTDGFLVPAPSVTPDTSSTFYGLRLVQVDDGDWLVDRVEMHNTSDFAALNAPSIGEQLSQPVSSNEVVAIYPLYIQSTAGGIIFDLRDAWYNINVDSADEKSVALTGDALSSSIEQLSTEYHLNHFHDRDNDLSVGQILSGSNPPVWMVNDYDLLVRHRGQTNPNGKYANELHYLCLQDLVDNLSGSNISSDIPDKLSSMIPKADEKSVSLTGDILSNSVGKLSSEFHLKHFHDRENDLSVGQIVSGDKPPVWMVKDYDLLVRHRGQTSPTNNGYVNELFYICLQDLVDSLSSGTKPGGGQDEIEPDQLSSIPVAGMFAWTESTKTIGPGGCMVGRQWYTCTNGIGSGKLDGLYQLKVTMHPDNATLMVVSDAPLGKAPTANQNSAETWIPIYQIVDGKIAADYRGAFVVPAYE